jgi:gamma-glutamyltranspeptidase/glutathione hydrolase
MYLGDDDFADIPINKLVNEQYLKTQMKDYDHLKAGVSKALDMEYLQQESMETTHLSVVDNQGNSVSVTTTLNMAYGSQVIVGGAGFILNNEMNDFSLKPGTYNASGGVGGIKNAIAPGKRMLSSMSPAIVVKDNELFMVLGSPGGTTIPTSVFQTIVNVIDFKMSLTAAVDSPKFHHEWLPDILYMEAGFPDSVKNKLCNMGYSLQERSLGRVEAILKTAKGNLEIVADKRGVKDSAEGY